MISDRTDRPGELPTDRLYDQKELSIQIPVWFTKSCKLVIYRYVEISRQPLLVDPAESN